jgi:hypothetical protein
MNEYLSELISQSYRTGRVRKPNRNNPVTIKRLQINKQLANDAENFSGGETVKQLIADNAPIINKYIVSKGETPRANLEDAALQAYLLRKKEEVELSQTLGVPLQDAAVYIDESEAYQSSVNSSEADYFLGGLVDALGQAVHSKLQKAADKRTEKKGKAGFLGFLANATAPRQSVQDIEQDIKDKAVNAGSAAIDAVSKGGTGNGGFLDQLKDFGKYVIGGIKDDQKKKEINKMLPTFIIGAVILIVLTVLITSYAVKRK